MTVQIHKNIQFPFHFKPKTDFGWDDFMVTKCNQDAVKIISLWPDWPFFAFSIYGPKGCGKSHLAHMFAELVSSRVEKPLKVKIMNAADLKIRKIQQIHDENPCLVVENMNSKVDEQALFHLFNLYHNEGGYLLFTSEFALPRLPLKLPDLRSRLNLVPSVSIKEPDDELLTLLVVKLFNDRQIVISQEVLNYIVQNMQRSFSFAQRLVEEIDTVSLIYKRAVSVPIVKEALQSLNKNVQQELFD